METYANLGGDSGIAGYEIGDDYITVIFTTEARYTYTYESAGVDAVETMKELAESGQGLNSYISTNKPGHAMKS